MAREVGLFFFKDGATPEIYTLPLHDALPICEVAEQHREMTTLGGGLRRRHARRRACRRALGGSRLSADRKSTRLNSSHANTSYAVFCLKKNNPHARTRRHRSAPLGRCTRGIP